MGHQTLRMRINNYAGSRDTCGYMILATLFLATICLTQQRERHGRLVLRPGRFAEREELPSFRSPKKSFDSFYDLATVPREVVEYVRAWTADASSCENDESALQVRCCKKSPQCGGISDRVRGISTLLRAAEAANRKLCFSKNHFMLGPLPDCRNGAYRHVTFFEGESVITPELFRDVKYVASNMLASIPKIGIENSVVDSKKVGFVALALSGVLNDEVARAKSVIQSVIELTSNHEPNHGTPGVQRGHSFIALHVRCGGATFENTRGDVVSCNDVPDGFNTSIPDKLLHAARRLPRNLYCPRPLYLASDSPRYLAELQTALPNGLAAITCCNKPLHMDKTELVRSRNKQHIVDMTAFSLAQSIFGTKGGFAQLGSLARNWGAVPIEHWPARDDEWAAYEYLAKLKFALGCQVML